MENVIIWHNPRCRKSREGLKFLEDRGIKPEIFEYLKTPIDAQKLASIIEKSGQPLQRFIRNKEADYKTLGLKEIELDAVSFAKIAADHPKLLERPIIIHGEKAILGRPADDIAKIL